MAASVPAATIGMNASQIQLASFLGDGVGVKGTWPNELDGSGEVVPDGGTDVAESTSSLESPLDLT